MEATISLDSVWNMIQSLSIDNQKWLADKVYEEIARKQQKGKELVFPHRPAGKEVSPEVKAMVIDRLPVDFDFERETEKMWKEWAK
jgi:hypothetical protein